MGAAPIADAADACEHPCTLKKHLLIARSALHVPSMKHHLAPLLILREAGLAVNEAPKCQAQGRPSEEHYSASSDKNGLRIPLPLNGAFSCFSTLAPAMEDLGDPGSATPVLPSPEGPQWNPSTGASSGNEDCFVDWEGGIAEERGRHTVLIEEEDAPAEEDNMAGADAEAAVARMAAKNAESSICTEDELKRVHEAMALASAAGEAQQLPDWSGIPDDQDEVDAVLSSMDPNLNVGRFAQALHGKAVESNFKMPIGSATAGNENEDGGLLVPPRMETKTAGSTGPARNISGSEVSKSKGADPGMLPKAWRIDLPAARRALEATTQLKEHETGGAFSRNCSANGRMLRHGRIKPHFLTDAFFVTKKARSARGCTCMQLFVSGKGFVCVVPMKKKSQFKLALKRFAKEVGAPEALIAGPSGEQTSNEVRQFCHEIATTLRALEEGTQHANCTELLIGLAKEAVRKGMKEAGSPLVPWDHCAERRARISNLAAKDLFQLEGQAPYCHTFGAEGDVPSSCNFGWHEWGHCREQKNLFPLEREVLRRMLGSTKDAGNEMAQWCPKKNGKAVARRTARGLAPSERNSEKEKENGLVLLDDFLAIYGIFFNPANLQFRSAMESWQGTGVAD